jgi:hypothetical protein
MRPVPVPRARRAVGTMAPHSSSVSSRKTEVSSSYARARVESQLMPELLDGPAGREASVIRQEMRTPRAAAVAGVVFSALLIVALVLLQLAVRDTPSDGGVWLTNQTHRESVLVALALIPFAAIAFLWFIGVVRNHIGEHEDRFVATVFLGSGLLFLAMLLAAAAIAGSLVESAHQDSALAASGVWNVAQRAAKTLIYVYAMRMAAVFMISTSTLLSRGGLAPRLLALSGYVIAAVLLIVIATITWAALLFPAWVMLVSLYILRRG